MTSDILSKVKPPYFDAIGVFGRAVYLRSIQTGRVDQNDGVTHDALALEHM